MIHIDHLNVSLNDKSILKNIDLTVKQGTYFGLIGPNGSGKTTLLKTIARLIPSDAGQIQIAGNDLSAYKPKVMAQYLSYVPQDTTIDFNFNVKDIVMMGRHAHGRFLNKNTTDETIVREAMEATDTWRFARHSILNLSGGQRQLVFIAKAIAQDTPLILLDEPIAALDVYYQMHILKLLKSLTEQGKTVVIVLHDLNLAARFCETLVLLREGEVEAYGAVEQVLTKETLKETYHINADIREDKRIQALQVTPL